MHLLLTLLEYETHSLESLSLASLSSLLFPVPSWGGGGVGLRVSESDLEKSQPTSQVPQVCDFHAFRDSKAACYCPSVTENPQQVFVLEVRGGTGSGSCCHLPPGLVVL